MNRVEKYVQDQKKKLEEELIEKFSKKDNNAKILSLFKDIAREEETPLANVIIKWKQEDNFPILKL